MEINAEQVKKALECCLEDVANCNNCPYERYCDMHENNMLRDALALINSQEQRIKELEAECKQWRSDWEKNQKRWEIAYDELDKEKHDLELTLVGVMFSVDKWLDGAELEQDEVNRAITMREKTLQIVEKLTEQWEEATNRANYIADVTRADTVRKMQERLDKRFCHDPAFLGVEQRLIMDIIDQIAKEMLEVAELGEVARECKKTVDKRFSSSVTDSEGENNENVS